LSHGSFDIRFKEKTTAQLATPITDLQNNLPSFRTPITEQATEQITASKTSLQNNLPKQATDQLTAPNKDLQNNLPQHLPPTDWDLLWRRVLNMKQPNTGKYKHSIYPYRYKG
jgi:hypothetical protein